MSPTLDRLFQHPRLRRFLADLGDVVFAPTCLGCHRLIAPADSCRLVCRWCRSRLRPPPPPLCPRCGAPRLVTGRLPAARCLHCRSWPDVVRAARSAYILQPPANHLVHQLKYRGWPALAEPLGQLLAGVRLPADAQAESQLCIPVPTTVARRRERGYNQAELLARAFARATGRRCLNMLERVGAHASQTTLQPAARRANVVGSFRVGGPSSPIRTQHVLLIDDVLTTGATAVECAMTLARAGARCITIVTFARALDAHRLT